MTKDPFDDALARLLADQTGDGGVCPDADTLAAYWERALPAEERAACDGHVAACPRCQAQLAGLARMAEGEPSAPAAHRPPWWLDWRWLTPLATTAVALVAIWIVDPSPRGNRAVPDTAESLSAPTTGAVDAPARAPAPERADEATPTGGRAPERRPTPPPERDGPAETEAAETEAAETEAAVSATRASEVLPPAREAVRDRQPATGVRRAEPSTLDRLAARAPGPIVITGPDGRVRWRLTPAGAVERSADGGETWSRQLAPEGVPRAGAAPSETVCWIVGENGLVLRTVDAGRSWERLTAPTETDLDVVVATDADVAIVRGTDGRLFETRDGGETWSAP